MGGGAETPGAGSHHIADNTHATIASSTAMIDSARPCTLV
jgi:hypothetical protein